MNDSDISRFGDSCREVCTIIENENVCRKVSTIFTNVDFAEKCYASRKFRFVQMNCYVVFSEVFGLNTYLTEIQ